MAKSKKINVVYQNEGAETIPFTISGNHITFGDDELTINLERHERDFDTTLDITRDRFGTLLMGVVTGRADAFVAQVRIPARRFEVVEVEAEDEDGGSLLAGVTPMATRIDLADGGTDVAIETRKGREIQKSTPIPFELKLCTIELWTLL